MNKLAKQDKKHEIQERKKRNLAIKLRNWILYNVYKDLI